MNTHNDSPSNGRQASRPTLKSHTEELRDAIVGLFLESGGEPVSGTLLSEYTGVTRTAVWKHIQHLEELGFRFEAVPRVGHRLLFVPDLLMEPLLGRALPVDVNLGRRITFSPEVDSTNRVAGALASDGVAPHGTIVSARSQTGGRGRRGRVWFSPPEGLWFSIVLRRPVTLRRAAELTLMTSVLIRRVLHDMTGLPVEIKWPNDLLLNGRKICGVLAEIKADGEQVEHAILGIGLNCNTPKEDFPDELRDIATSIFAESGRTLDRVEFGARFLASFEPYYDALANGEPAFSLLHEEWTAYSATLGKHIRIQTGQDVLEGVATALQPSGTLVLRDDKGELIEVHSGDILFSN